jgi:hypothetical protein
MELRETIESINYKLVKEFGKELNGAPKFRVVFSEDQYEKRWTSFTYDGFELLQPEVRLLPKYKQFIHEKYILERLIPIIGETDLVDKVSYEPAWVFQDKNQNYLPPFFEGCRFVIESMYEAMGMKGHVKYRDPLVSEEQRLEQIKKVEQELFGNETDLADNLHYGSGVGFTASKLLH